MQQFAKTFLLGLATILPVALTIYLVYASATWAEHLIGDALKSVLPAEYYLPGMGLFLAVLGVTLTGLLVRIPGLPLLLRINDAVMTRIPLVKTLYTTIRDLMDLFASGERNGRAVRVKLWDDIEAIGLVTRDDPESDRALVYLPFSYQIGGHLVSLKKDRIEEIDMSVDEALRYVVTAGIRRSD